MSLGTTLVNHNRTPIATHGLGAQLNMLDCKMSSGLSPAAPAHILSECYIGMWDTEMAHPPPTKLETTDIMDMIEPTMNGGANNPSNGCLEGDGSQTTSPTTIIHHPGEPQHPQQARNEHVSRSGGNGGVSTNYSVISSSASSSSSSASSTSSSTSSYLTPLPSMGDPYSSTGEGHLLDGFHGGMEPPFHKLSQASHAFQEGGYDAFISDLSHPSTNGQMPSHHHHPDDHNQQHHHHHHHQHSHLPPPSHLSNGMTSTTPCHDNGVLLLDMSNHHPHHIQPSGGNHCPPGCGCGGNPYSLGGDGLGELCPPPGALTQSHHHHPHHHPHSHHPDYSSSTWDDLHCDPGDYSSIMFRKGESPTTSDSVSYTDNDSESKSSAGSLLGSNEITHISPPKRKVGRPPKKDKKLKRNEKKTGRLWEFIRDLLKNPEYCPSLVKWENHEEGHFRFVNSEKVAQLWDQIKGNPRMTYEKLSRAMRYYYKSHVFEPVLGRRLVYKFGYNATNWKPINPNFANSSHPKMYN